MSLAPDARCLLLRYAKHLDLWRLGDTDGCQPDHTQHSLPLSHNVQRLVQLLSKDGQHVRCGAVSCDARWLAYSTDSLFRLYSVDLDSVSDNSFLVNLLKKLKLCLSDFNGIRTVTKFWIKQLFLGTKEKKA